MFLIESSNVARPQFKLIAEKIAVPANTPSLQRPRLFERLEQSLGSCTSTIISGRAGTGKTSLALDFARKCGRNIAWYKVDAPESELEVFLQYLIASIQKQRPGFGATLIPLPDAITAAPDQISVLAEAFVYELVEGVGEPLLIVIEDLHLVCDSPWLVPFFKRLLPLMPSDVHLLITSRTMPPAPLWRMRSKQTLSVIDEAALAFTTPEAIDLFERYGLAPEHASIALDHTQGRAGSLARFAGTLCHVVI